MQFIYAIVSTSTQLPETIKLQMEQEIVHVQDFSLFLIFWRDSEENDLGFLDKNLEFHLFLES